MANGLIKTSSYPKTFLIDDFEMADTVDVVSNDFVNVAKYRVPVRQIVTNGNGRINLGVDDRGLAKIDVKDSTPTSIAGVWRIVVADANEINKQFIREIISDDMIAGVRMGVGGKTGNENKVISASEYAYIILQFRSIAASATIVKANSTMAYPVQVETLS